MGKRKVYLIKLQIHLRDNASLDDFRTIVHDDLQSFINSLQGDDRVKDASIKRIQARPVQSE